MHAAILVGSVLAIGGAVSAQNSQEQDPQQMSYLRVVHASPDAPPVVVLVKGNRPK